MIPGELFPAEGEIILNASAETVALMVANTGDRPVQVGSHYHFAETNPALDFDRAAAHGLRLDIAPGTAVRFEPGQSREVSLVPIGGMRKVYGFNQKVMGYRAQSYVPLASRGFCCCRIRDLRSGFRPWVGL